MAHVDLYYRKLIGLIYTHTKPGCKIIMHTYDYSIPNGIGVFGSHGWLKPAMMDAGVPAQLQQACVKFLLDAFYDVLDNIRKQTLRTWTSWTVEARCCLTSGRTNFTPPVPASRKSRMSAGNQY